VQNGTRHAWRNLSARPATVAVVQIGPNGRDNGVAGLGGRELREQHRPAAVQLVPAAAMRSSQVSGACSLRV
jgi:hypothetical protein